MRIIKLTALLALSVLMFSCSEKLDEEKPIVGNWHNYPNDVDIITITGRGTFCTVEDDAINEDILDFGTLHIYIRSIVGKAKTYYHVPSSGVPGFGRVDRAEAGEKGYGFRIEDTPPSTLLALLAVRAIIIPADLGLPSDLDMTDYEAVADYFNLKD